MDEVRALAPTRNRSHRRAMSGNAMWSRDEDMRLSMLVENERAISWCSLARHFPGKTAQQLAGRWEKVLDPRLVKGSWTREEDEIVLSFVSRHGDRNWAKLAALLNGRTGKQCRERFKNHLDPSVSREPWTTVEDDTLIQLHERFGNAWTKLASFFPGRTDNCVKNRWNSTVSKRLERIEKGEPLVMKRGRKPKSHFDGPVPSKADLIQEDDDIRSTECSSPVVNREPTRSMIELLPFVGGYSLVVPSNGPRRTTMSSVQENRDGLRRLLSDAS